MDWNYSDVHAPIGYHLVVRVTFFPVSHQKLHPLVKKRKNKKITWNLQEKVQIHEVLHCMWLVIHMKMYLFINTPYCSLHLCNTWAYAKVKTGFRVHWKTYFIFNPSTIQMWFFDEFDSFSSPCFRFIFPFFTLLSFFFFFDCVCSVKIGTTFSPLHFENCDVCV